MNPMPSTRKAQAQAIREACITAARHNIGKALDAHQNDSISTAELRVKINDTLTQMARFMPLPDIWGMPAREHFNQAVDSFENGINSQRDLQTVIRLAIDMMERADEFDFGNPDAIRARLRSKSRSRSVTSA